MRLGVLLENEALIDMAELMLPGLSTRKSILTEVFETIKLLWAGSSEPSSGSAEVKSQSSSADVPLVGCCGLAVSWLCGTAVFGDAKSNKDGDGAGAGFWDGCEDGSGDAVREAADDSPAKGSVEGCGGFGACCAWSRVGGAGVLDRDEGMELVTNLKGS